MVDIDPELLAILACPCPQHAPVELAAESLRCTRCQTTFPIRDGIPVMLLDEATPGPGGIGGATG
jgi:uncharacterized protein YbaR (Trm112 family)